LKSPWFWFRALVAIIAVGVLVATLDWREALVRLVNLSPVWLLVAVALNALALIVSAWRWRRLARVIVDRIGLGEAIRLYWIGALFSTVLPSNIGGDVVRLAMARRLGSLARVLASIMIERISGLLVIAALGVVALIFLPQIEQVVPMHQWVLGALACGLVAVPLVLFGGAHWFERWTERATANLPPAVGKLTGKLGQLAAALNVYRDNRGELLFSLVTSLVFYAILFAFQGSLIRAVGGEITLAGLLIAAPMVILVSSLPISINGIGISEGVFVVLYAHLGTDPEAALAADVLRRLVITAVAAFGLVFWLQVRDTVPQAAAQSS